MTNSFSTYRFRRDSAPWWWLEAVCRHACVSRAEARYCLSRNRIGPVKLEEGSTTCPFCKISSTPSQANCTAMRRVSGISGRHAVVRARGASEGQQVFVMPRLRTSSRILASSAPSASGLHSSRWRFGIVAKPERKERAAGACQLCQLGAGKGRKTNALADEWAECGGGSLCHRLTVASAHMNDTHTLLSSIGRL